MDNQYRISVIGEFRFEREEEMFAFKSRLNEFLERERRVYILEPNLDVSIITKEFKENYGNFIEVPSKRTSLRI